MVEWGRAIRRKFDLDNTIITEENISEEAVKQLNVMRELIQDGQEREKLLESKVNSLQKALDEQKELIAQLASEQFKTNELLSTLLKRSSQIPSNFSDHVTSSESHDTIASSPSKRFASLLVDEATVQGHTASVLDSKKQKTYSIFDKKTKTTSFKVETIDISRPVLLLFEQFAKNPSGCLDATPTLGTYDRKYSAEMKHLYSIASDSSDIKKILRRDNPGEDNVRYKQYPTDLTTACAEVVAQAFNLYFLPYEESLSRKGACDYSSITLSQLAKARSKYNSTNATTTPSKSAFLSSSSSSFSTSTKKNYLYIYI
jgi:hypothetical protein